jgi:hypothetical protein
VSYFEFILQYYLGDRPYYLLLMSIDCSIIFIHDLAVLVCGSASNKKIAES